MFWNTGASVRLQRGDWQHRTTSGVNQRLPVCLVFRSSTLRENKPWQISSYATETTKFLVADSLGRQGTKLQRITGKQATETVAERTLEMIHQNCQSLSSIFFFFFSTVKYKTNEVRCDMSFDAAALAEM